MKQTALECFYEKVIDLIGTNKMVDVEFEQAKEMEKQQIIDCSIQTTQDCFISVMNSFGQNINFTEEDLKNQRLEAEQYYNETYKK